MFYNILSCVCSHVGNIRTKNDDNVCFNGIVNIQNNKELFLQSVEKPISTLNTSIFAIFDGIGGFSESQIASKLASDVFADYINNLGTVQNLFNTNIPKILNELCLKANDIICQKRLDTHLNLGTTCACVVFKNNSLYICNVGDSKIFRFYNNELTQISMDHVSNFLSSSNKPKIYQYLGLNEIDVIIEPYIEKFKILPNEIYLLCSDGLTDLVSLEKISQVLNEKSSLEQSLQILLNEALNNGGNDNISIILCEVQ